MEKIISAIVIFFSSIIKFGMGTIAIISADLGLGASLANIIGGIIGIVLFTYLGNFIQDYVVKKFPRTFGRRFTRSNRFLVRVKQRFGLGGIAALTPVVLSIPVGVMFALALTHDKKKILFTMLMSLFFWATLFFVPYFLFNVNLVDMLKSLFERG